MIERTAKGGSGWGRETEGERERDACAILRIMRDGKGIVRADDGWSGSSSSDVLRRRERVWCVLVRRGRGTMRVLHAVPRGLNDAIVGRERALLQREPEPGRHALDEPQLHRLGAEVARQVRTQLVVAAGPGGRWRVAVKGHGARRVVRDD